MAIVKVLHLNLPPVPVDYARERLSPLGAEVVAGATRDPGELVELARDVDAIMAAGIGRIADADVLAQLPKLRHVSVWAGATDFLDADAFTAAGVVVSFAADDCTEEVVDHGMAMMLTLARRLRHWDRAMRGNRGVYVPHDDVIDRGRPMPRLSTLTCGTIGFGRAGQALAARARAFGMRVVAHDPFLRHDAPVLTRLGVELLNKEQVLAESDYLHLYVPMSTDTVHVIGAEDLARMKPTAYLVNASARATVIDETALYGALTSGALAGAALDNLENRDGEVNPLLNLDNVILSPHIAHVSDTSYELMRQRICDDIVGFFSGRWPRLLANPAVKERVTLPDGGGRASRR